MRLAPVALAVAVFLAQAGPAPADQHPRVKMLEDCARNAAAALMRETTMQERVDGLYELLWGLYAASDRALILRECAWTVP